MTAMEEEIIIIVTRKQAKALEGTSVAELADSADGLVRRFTGPERFKKSLKFLRALEAVTE
jgi:hypothetical protein